MCIIQNKETKLIIKINETCNEKPTGFGLHVTTLQLI